ncbi:hypothetical protein AX17_004785 [Amanita inopinata Kibby_2008]|nr:hypothetical protein AX17_004785 [Amanita inopinata Kibby_2008]
MGIRSTPVFILLTVEEQISLSHALSLLLASIGQGHFFNPLDKLFRHLPASGASFSSAPRRTPEEETLINTILSPIQECFHRVNAMMSAFEREMAMFHLSMNAMGQQFDQIQTRLDRIMGILEAMPVQQQARVETAVSHAEVGDVDDDEDEDSDDCENIVVDIQSACNYGVHEKDKEEPRRNP